MALLLKCPKCGNNQLYQPNSISKTKKCVYCGKTFKAREQIVKAA